MDTLATLIAALTQQQLTQLGVQLDSPSDAKWLEWTLRRFLRAGDIPRLLKAVNAFQLVDSTQTLAVHAIFEMADGDQFPRHMASAAAEKLVRINVPASASSLTRETDIVILLTVAVWGRDDGPRMVAIECLRKNQVTPAVTTIPCTPCPGDTVDVRNGKLVKDVLQIIWSLNPILATRAAALILHDSTRSDRIRQIGGDFLARHGKAGWLLGHLHEDDSTESVLHGGKKVLERIAKQSLSQSGIDQLVRFARDESPTVRRRTIDLLADAADPRAVGELLSSLNDVDHRVCRRAREVLDGSGARCVRLNGFIRQFHGCSYDVILERIAAINRWAREVGTELLGRPVLIENYRQGLGRTKRVKRDSPITIEVTDTPVTSGHPHGEDIMRGLVLHEIGHHLCDFRSPGFRTTDGIARSEGIGNIYDILLDERLERILRSRRPEWGVYFDRISSYAFAQNDNRVPLHGFAQLVEKSLADTRAALDAGQLPGQLIETSPSLSDEVLLRDSDMLRIPGLVPAEMAFLACLRCGFDPDSHPDSRVSEAVATVPSNLKDLPHKGVLEAARRIARILNVTPKTKEDIERFRRGMESQEGALGDLSAAWDRLAEAGQLPEWPPPGAPKIRILPPDPPPGRTEKRPGGAGLNLGKELGFSPLKREVTLNHDPEANSRLVATVRRDVRRLRPYFERLGTRSEEQYASRRGQRLDLAQIRSALLRRSPNLLVYHNEVTAPSAYIGLLIDRSGSMEGEKIHRAKRFAALVAESLKGLPGIEGHVNAFDDDTFYWLGGFSSNAIASLGAAGGNNDAAALERAAAVALASHKQHKLLVMISDGLPSGCTFQSLKEVVSHLTNRQGIVCAQAAVAPIEHVAFPHYVDLSRHSADEAVTRFGRLLIQLTRDWR